jgi:hypothetical protein
MPATPLHHIHVIRALVLYAVHCFAILTTAEYRLNAAALMLAELAHQIDIIRALVLHTVQRLGILTTTECSFSVAPLMLAAPVTLLGMSGKPSCKRLFGLAKGPECQTFCGQLRIPTGGTAKFTSSVAISFIFDRIWNFQFNGARYRTNKIASTMMC